MTGSPPPPSSCSVHILGGGLAGLSAGSDLAKKGRSLKVIEAQDNVGGLAQSFKIGEYTCDLGPHRFHSNSDAIIDHIRGALGDNIHMRDRVSRIFRFGKFIDYPLRASNVLRSLPIHVLIKAMLDYWAMRIRLKFSPLPDDSFKNYVRKRFGNTLYELFFGTYTEKAWQIPASQISPDWAGQRITLINLWDVVKKTLFPPKDVPRTLVARFHYPAEGGIGSISQGYRRIIEAAGNEVVTGAHVEKLTREGDRIVSITYLKDGELIEEPVEHVVSTIPINRVVEQMQPVPPANVLEAAANLKHKAILFIYIMLDREQVTKDHWVYLPEKELTVHRISEFKNFSEQTCPEGKTLLCAEITCNRDDERWQMTDEQLSEISIGDLTRIGLFGPEEVLETAVRRVPYAYPLYDLTYRKNLQVVLGHIKPIKNLTSTGRQGLFRYGNMDHSVAMGARCARSLTTGSGPGHDEIASNPEESFD